MDLVPVSVLGGVIFTRNAMLVKDVDMELYPLSINIVVSLGLSGCRPAGAGEVEVEFTFSKVSCFSVFRLDDYPWDKFSKSSFDKFVGEKKYVVRTYDHVFVVAGDCQVIWGGELVNVLGEQPCA